jgi:spermidine synthase
MKNDVESIIMEKKPKQCVGNIVYLTDGPTDNKTSADRKTLYRDTEYLVEDVRDPSGEVTRRLVFVKSFQRVQSQVVLEYADGQLDSANQAWGLLAAKEGKKPARNTKMLDFAYNRVLFFAVNVFGEGPRDNGVIIGLGSGILGDFFKTYQPQIQLTEVESSDKVISLATDFFLYNRKAIKADGVEFVSSVAEASTNFIIVDVDDSQVADSTVPTHAFNTSKFVSAAFKALTKGGVLAVNCIPKAGGSHKALIEEMHHHFGQVWEIPALREEYSVYVSVKGAGEGQEPGWAAWSKWGEKRTKALQNEILKGNKDDWEENEFADISEGVRLASGDISTKAN